MAEAVLQAKAHYQGLLEKARERPHSISDGPGSMLTASEVQSMLQATVTAVKIDVRSMVSYL